MKKEEKTKPESKKLDNLKEDSVKSTDKLKGGRIETTIYNSDPRLNAFSGSA